jgi:hypothetical protein
MTLFSGVEPEISLIDPGQQDIIEGHRPDAIAGLLQGDILLRQCIADEELTLLEAERTGVAHPAHQVVTWVS